VDNLIAGKESDKNIVLYLSLVHGAWSRAADKKMASQVSEKKVMTLQDRLTFLQEESKSIKLKNTVLEEKINVLTKLLEQETEEKVVLKGTKEGESSRISSEKEELKKAKQKLDKEKSELAIEHENLLQQIKKQQKAREELEDAVKKEQSKGGIAMEFLRKNLLEHLYDLDFSKEFLEQERQFKKEDVQLLKKEDIQNLSYDDQALKLTKALEEENKRLENLLEEREKFHNRPEKNQSPPGSPPSSPLASPERSARKPKGKKSDVNVPEKVQKKSKKDLS